MSELTNEKLAATVAIEMLISLATMLPMLIQNFQDKLDLTPEEINLYRNRLKRSMQMLEKSWDDYLNEAQEIYGGKQ